MCEVHDSRFNARDPADCACCRVHGRCLAATGAHTNCRTGSLEPTRRGWVSGGDACSIQARRIGSPYPLDGSHSLPVGAHVWARICLLLQAQARGRAGTSELAKCSRDAQPLPVIAARRWCSFLLQSSSRLSYPLPLTGSSCAEHTGILVRPTPFSSDLSSLVQAADALAYTDLLLQDPLARGWTRGGEIYLWVPKGVKSESEIDWPPVSGRAYVPADDSRRRLFQLLPAAAP